MDILIIHRYLSNEASEKERDELHQWLEESDENLRQFNNIQKIYKVEIRHRDDFEVRTALLRFRKVMDEDVSEAPVNPGSPARTKYPVRNKSRVWLKVAAVMAIGLFLSLYAVPAYLDLDHNDTEELALDAGGQSVIETNRGEQKAFRLKDGTRIHLNASSKLSVASNYGVSDRVVILSGEAFFDVFPDPDQEFIVQTSTANTTVLGTTFTVRAWGGRDESIVAVEKGSVSVQSATPGINEETILHAGEYSHVRTGEAPGPALQEHINQYLGWKNQVFVFEETPLEDVLHQLELHFNVRITVKDSTSLEDPVTARYENESLDEILRYTSITHGIELETESIN